ncbi:MULTISPECIES: hypothetical protein [Paenibacillus]|nr:MULTISPECIES: hypothetical protein [Paenibacillus]
MKSNTSIVEYSILGLIGIYSSPNRKESGSVLLRLIIALPLQ